MKHFEGDDHQCSLIAFSPRPSQVLILMLVILRVSVWSQGVRLICRMWAELNAGLTELWQVFQILPLGTPWKIADLLQISHPVQSHFGFSLYIQMKHWINLRSAVWTHWCCCIMHLSWRWAWIFPNYWNICSGIGICDLWKNTGKHGKTTIDW